MIGAAGIPAGAVLDTQELADDPTFDERGIMQTIEHPTARTFKMPAWPVRFNGTPAAVKPAPLLGEHSGEVLKSWLGLSARDIDGLTQDKVDSQRSSEQSRTATAYVRQEETTMAELTGSEILAKALKNEGTEDLFFIMGGPMLLAETSCIKEGIRMIDVRHEQAAALMGAGLQPAAAEARRVHGGERPRRDQPDDRPRQRADRLLPGRRDRRLEPDRPVRPAGVPGDRPGRDHEAAA